MSYTIRNLSEVQDVAAGAGLSDIQEARFARADLEAEHTGVSLQRIKPGRRQAFAHRHAHAEEIYVVLDGTGRIKLEDEVRDIGPLDAIRVSPQVTRAFEAGEDGLQLLVFGPHHQGDGEMIQGSFWD